MSDGPKPISTLTVWWQKCVEKTWEIKNPITGRVIKSWTLKGCIRIFDQDGTLYIELQIDDLKQKFALTDTCYKLRKYVFVLEACISDLELDGIKPKSFKIVINGCIDASYKGIGIKECLKLYETRVSLFRIEGANLIDELEGSDILCFESAA
jgi:hypothetical protein